MFSVDGLLDWFAVKDVFIDIFSMLVSAVVLFYAFRFHRLNKSQKKYSFIIMSFLFLTLSFIFKVISHIVLYMSSPGVKQVGIITLTYQSMESVEIGIFFGILLFRIAALLSLYFFYSTYSEKQSKSSMIIIIYLLLAVGYFSQQSYYFYHITAFIILLAICYYLFKVYKKNEYATTLLLTSSFAIIMLSRVLFIFLGVTALFYIMAEVVQLIGYLLLSMTFILVLNHGKKKK